MAGSVQRHVAREGHVGRLTSDVGVVSSLIGPERCSEIDLEPRAAESDELYLGLLGEEQTFWLCDPVSGERLDLAARDGSGFHHPDARSPDYSQCRIYRISATIRAFG